MSSMPLRRHALERGWLRLWVLEADGKAVAAWYGFRFAQIDWYYQSGRDPDWERQSVGFVLLAHTIAGRSTTGCSSTACYAAARVTRIASPPTTPASRRSRSRAGS